MNSILNFIKNSQFFKFFGVGAINTGFTWLMFVYLVNLANISHTSALFYSWLLGVIITYSLNYSFVFSKVENVCKKSSFTKFMVVAVGYFCVNYILLEILVSELQFRADVSQTILIPILFIMRYYVSKKWVFISDGSIN